MDKDNGKHKGKDNCMVDTHQLLISNLTTLPREIIINHIIPYTYHTQIKPLLEDIENYCDIYSKLSVKRFNINLIKHEILAIFYTFGQDVLENIKRRAFRTNITLYAPYNYIYNYPTNKIFGILFGLFTKEERSRFLDHILEDGGIFFAAN